MKKLGGITVFILSSLLISCGGGGGDANLEIVVPTSPMFLIPASAASCLSRKTSSGAPNEDISPSYFRIPTIKFNRKDATKTLVLSLMRISIRLPGSSSVYNCEIGGDALAALSTNWWATTTREAIVAAGTTTFSTDCPLYCGGVDSKNTYVASGPLEVFGFERDETTLEETPVKVQASVSIQSY